MSTTVKNEKVDLQAGLTTDEARKISKEAYIYGFPLVDNYRIQYAYFVNKSDPEYKTNWNTLNNTARVYTAQDKTVQSPNSDTPYSFIGADLRAEPLVISVPGFEKRRYYSIQFIDMYTFVFAYVGSRTTGSDSGNFLLVGPAWKGEVPAGIKEVIRSETEFAFALFRTQLFNPADIENVKMIQAGYKVQTLSQFQGKPGPTKAHAIQFMKPFIAERENRSIDFFNVLNFILQFCPTHPSEKELRARFEKLGIVAGKEFQVKDDEIKKAIEDGIDDAWKIYDETKKLVYEGKVTSSDVFGSREDLMNNYVYRFLAAKDGIYGNVSEEAIYPSYFTDEKGDKLDGSTNKYILRFREGQLPPVNAFWSLTMYQLPQSLLYGNPLDRYLISSSMLPGLTKDEDGSITIYIQHESPGKNKESNWLPAPKGPFLCALRLYWPKSTVLEGKWKQPPLEKVD
jgi:hypothetical protein